MRDLEDRYGLIDYLSQSDSENADMEALMSIYYEESYCRYESMSDDELLDYLEEEDYKVPASLSAFVLGEE